MTDEKAGLYYWSSIEREDVKGTLDMEDTGLCILDATGDTISSSEYSSVAVFKDGTDLYCIEAFDREVLVMQGKLVDEPAH